MGNKVSTNNTRRRRNGSTLQKKVGVNDSDINEKEVQETSSFNNSTSDSMLASGRTFHQQQNSTYWFPNDEEEMDRLIGQHFALKSLFNGNISNKIVNGLGLESNSNKILDLGCGPGTWIMDVATEYPMNQFIGVDMCDVFPNNIRPANVSFQVGNALEQLPFPDNSFDYINIRLFIIGLKKEEWPIIVQEIYRLLRPGGYVQMTECSMLKGGTEFVKVAGKQFADIVEGRGQVPYIADELDTLLENQHFNVLEIEKREVCLGNQDALSKEFLWDATTIFRTAQPVLQEPLGYSAETYPQFLEKLYKELQKKPDTFWSFSICVGQK